MSDVTQAFYDRMSSDATLVGLLGTYGGSPSILTKRPTPPDFTMGDNGPYVLTTGEAAQDPGPADVKNSSGRDILRDIFAFADIKTSPSVVEAIGERIRTLFHRQVFSINGFSIIVAEAGGPIEADEDDALGRMVTVHLVLAES